MNILDQIIEKKRREVTSKKQLIPAKVYMNSPAFEMRRPSFPESLQNKYPSVIAEFKRKSPSKGIINPEADLYEIITGYTSSGVNALSVLTDREFFGGSLCDLQDASILSHLPLLRKDFVIDEYQIIEAKSFGASAVLLIASVLTALEIKVLTARARELEMDVLFEVHDEIELDKWCPEIRMVGVNNRNLSTFEVNIDNSIKLLEKIPAECIKISESGISNPEMIRELHLSGFNAFLIGEAFMKTSKPWETAEEFILNLKGYKPGATINLDIP